MKLSPEERARIAADYGVKHVPANVTVIPRGVSSLPYPVYDQARGKVFYAAEDGAALSWKGKFYHIGRPLTPLAKSRRACVAKLGAKGMTASEIAKQIGCDPQRVSDDAKALGISLVKGGRWKKRA